MGGPDENIGFGFGSHTSCHDRYASHSAWKFTFGICRVITGNGWRCHSGIFFPAEVSFRNEALPMDLWLGAVVEMRSLQNHVKSAHGRGNLCLSLSLQQSELLEAMQTSILGTEIK
jgi:hypothetical protein